eukprot:10841159-Alexandrium_andersonii.AAC.1
MAHDIIYAVKSDLQATEQEQTTPMESDGMSEEMKERIEADAEEAARAGFPGIPVKPTEEYGA